MYERCSSSSIGCRETRGRCSWASSGMVHLDVQVHDFLRVLLDVLPAGLDGFTHEDGEQGIRGRGVLDRDLLQETAGRIHRRLPELVGVHLPEALVPLVYDTFVTELLREVFALLLRVRIVEFLALL